MLGPIALHCCPPVHARVAETQTRGVVSRKITNPRPTRSLGTSLILTSSSSLRGVHSCASLLSLSTQQCGASLPCLSITLHSDVEVSEGESVDAKTLAMELFGGGKAQKAKAVAKRALHEFETASALGEQKGQKPCKRA